MLTCGSEPGLAVRSDSRHASACERNVSKPSTRYLGTCSDACATEARRIIQAPTPETWRTETRYCLWCETQYTPTAATTYYCTLTCRRRAKHHRRRNNEHATVGQWRWSDFMRVARRFNYRCAYCGIKPERLDPDHVQPLSRQGANVIGNLLPTCMPCNSAKRDQTLTEWEAERQARDLPPRATSWSATDPRYWHLTAAPLTA